MTSEVIVFATCGDMIAAVARPDSQVGALLREWRAARGLSQLGLSLEVGVSARHLSCVESGKAQPSREMIARLADTLAMPLRERNVLLIAAGYAPQYAESALETPSLARVRNAIGLILKHQEPYPAFVMNRYWDVLLTNTAAKRMGDYLRGGSAHTNMVRQFFDPNDMRAVVVNWEEIARDLMRHVQDEVAANPSDTRAQALLDEMLRYPGVPARWQIRELGAAPPPLLTSVFRKGDVELRFFSTLTTFATPRDVTLEELRIECTFPADDVTDQVCRSLAKASASVEVGQDV
jgi:transcriptional regulator with XRE-family HTH domain